MTWQAEFINRQWAAHRDVMTHTPTTARLTCLWNGYRAHGGDWDRWTWKGDTQAAERAYCQCCGEQVRGIVSPWADAAIEDWYATPYMRRSFTAQRNGIAARRIKSELLGRRRILRGGTYGRTW